MSTIGRIGREYVAQIAAFAVALSDRLFIPAVFLRTLGVASFSAWSIAIAMAGFVSVLEFGVTRYFTNRLIELVERGEREQAWLVYQIGTTFVVSFALVALLAIAAGFAPLVKGVGDPTIDRQLFWLALPVTLAAAAVQLIGLRQALYRAHCLFVAETWIRLAGEAARIATIVIAALIGASLFAVCWLWFAATVAFIVVPIGWDTRRRFPGFADRAAVPPRGEVRAMATLAPGLWLQLMFTTLFATLPIMAVGAISAAPAVIAQFVLMRTLANFVRQILQMFANVFGIELARRHARGDGEGFARTFMESNRFLAVQIAVASATLYVLAEPLFRLWTGRPELFDREMLLLAILPPLLFPATTLTIEALSYINRPWPVVRARLAQVAITVVTFVLLDSMSAGMRMMIALFVGEVAGMGIPLVFAIRDANRRIGLFHSLGLIGYAAAAAALTLGIVGAVWQTPLQEWWRLGLAIVAGGATFVLAVLVVGMTAERRGSLLSLLRLR